MSGGSRWWGATVGRPKAPHGGKPEGVARGESAQVSPQFFEAIFRRLPPFILVLPVVGTIGATAVASTRSVYLFTLCIRFSGGSAHVGALLRGDNYFGRGG